MLAILCGKLFLLHDSIHTQSGTILEDHFRRWYLTRDSRLPMQLGCKGSRVPPGRGQVHNPAEAQWRSPWNYSRFMLFKASKPTFLDCCNHLSFQRIDIFRSHFWMLTFDLGVQIRCDRNRWNIQNANSAGEVFRKCEKAIRDFSSTLLRSSTCDSRLPIQIKWRENCELLVESRYTNLMGFIYKALETIAVLRPQNGYL